MSRQRAGGGAGRGGDGPAGGDAGRRLRMFRLHLAGYAIVSLILAVVNLLATPGNWWFVLFMVGWGAPLAVHVAHVMGWFDGGRS